MPQKPIPPISLRVNEDDLAVLEYLQQRLGLKAAQVIKLAIRRLQEQERKAERK